MLKPSEKITDGFDKDVTNKSDMYFSRKDDDIGILCSTLSSDGQDSYFS